ncbi:uncharacterized protein BO80DRAFT_362514, partial [Aspergillus ibericus CBS 121593]
VFLYLKNNNLYFYVNYKYLNNILIKIYYLSFFNLKILDRVLKIKSFLKMNIKNTYY